MGPWQTNEADLERRVYHIQCDMGLARGTNGGCISAWLQTPGRIRGQGVFEWKPLGQQWVPGQESYLMLFV